MVRQKGFSLIELVVVIVLVGILASVAMPRMFQSIDRAYEASVQSFASHLSSGIEVWKQEYLLKGGGAGRYEGIAVEKTLPIPENNEQCLAIANMGMTGARAQFKAYESTPFMADYAAWLSGTKPLPDETYAALYQSGGKYGKGCVYVYVRRVSQEALGVLYTPQVADANSPLVQFMAVDYREILNGFH
jgi:prepilin-type N-terminal cleavage/methylation domain-containing protein